MKQVKYITFAALFTLVTFCSILYTSCTKTDPCSLVSCLNGGQCNEGKCVCPSNYAGLYCEIALPIDSCLYVSCLNGGVCSGGNCNCQPGYEGKNCEILSKDKFVGSYWGMERCIVGTDYYEMTLVSGAANNQLILNNLYNYNFVATCTMAAPDSFLFSGAQSGVSYSGSGRLVGSELTIRFTISGSSSSTSCVFVGTK